MAWQTVATTGLGDSSATYGYVYLQYDDSSSGTSRSARLRFEIRSGYSVYVYIDNLSLDGSVVRSRFTCSGTMDFWTGSLANGTRSFTWSCPWYSGTRSYTCSGYIPSGVTAPSGLSVSVKSKTYDSITFSTSLSSYGVPSSSSGRYIEAAILNQNSYGASYRYETASNTSSATIAVDNSSRANPSSFSIEANHKYWYGGYASNTQASTSTVVGTVYTPCPPLSLLTPSTQTYAEYNKVNAVIQYKRQTDAGAETRTGYYRYSTDGGTTYSSWVSFGTVTVAAGSNATFTAKLPTNSNITLQAKLSTPNGGDSAIKTTTLTTIATHVAPNFQNYTYRDSNSATIQLTGNDQTMIQGQSIPEVLVSSSNKATGNDGINISNYAITFVGQSKTISYSSSADVSTLLNPPSESGTSNLTVSAVDELSLSKAVTKSVIIYPWQKPTISATIERVNNFESQSILNMSGKYSPIQIGNVVKNSLTVSYRTKKSSSSSWSAWTSRAATISGVNWSVSNLSVTLDNNYQWDVQVRVVDAFDSATADLILSIGMPNFFIGTDGRVSIGMKPNISLPNNNRGQLEVDGSIYSKGMPLISSHIGQVIMSTTLDTAAKVEAIYGGTWVAWGAGKVPVGVDPNDTDFNAPNKSGGSKTVTLTLEHIPSHSHQIRSGWSDNSPGSDAYRYQFWAANDLSWKGGNLGTSSVGGGKAHQNMPPYLTVYMWRRVS